jgi:putative membrane protein
MDYLSELTNPHIHGLIFTCSGPLGKLSIWRKVFPTCLLSCSLAVALSAFHHFGGWECSFSLEVHKILSPLLAFLLATRTNIGYNRYMEGRTSFGGVLLACRELTQQAITFSRHTGDPKKNCSTEMVEWRAEVTRMTVAVLHGIVCTLHNPTDRSLVIYQPYLRESEQDKLQSTLAESSVPHATLLLALWLRITISSNRECERSSLSALQYIELDQQVGKLVQSFHALTKLTSTPLPFPLVQMARTFLSIWVLTLPFALQSEIGHWNIVVSFFTPFFFLGLEYVAIELDDPFGADENDLDIRGMADSVIDDCRLFLVDCDGPGADAVFGERDIDDTPRSWTGERHAQPKNLFSMMKNRKSGLGTDRDRASKSERNSVEKNERPSTPRQAGYSLQVNTKKDNVV